jgi:hypothetical protein
MPPLQQQGGICGFFSTSNAAICTQIQQGGICVLTVMPPQQQGGIFGFFSTSNAAASTAY